MNVSTLARLELRNALAGGALRWIIATLLLLLFYASWNGWRWREFRMTAVESVRQEAAAQASTWLEDFDLHRAGRLDAAYEAPDQPYFVYAFFPWYAVVEQSPLSVLAVGQSDLHAYYAGGTMVTPNVLYHEEEIQNPVVLALGRFDLAFLLVVVLPVLAIALSFDLVAEDRRTGMDRMISIQGGSLRRVAVLRCALRFAWLTSAVVLPLALLLWSSGGAATGDSRTALAVVLLLTGAYIGFWFSLALLVNARGESAARNAVLLLAVWGVSSLFVPAAIDAIARLRHPMPAGVSRASEARRIVQTISDSAALARLARYEALQPDGAPDLVRETGWVASIEARRDTLAALDSADRAVVAARQRLADRLVPLSPALMLNRALEDAAAASTHHALSFQDAITRAVRERARITRRNVLEGRPAERGQLDVLSATVVVTVSPGRATPGFRWAAYLSLMIAYIAAAGGAATLLLRNEAS